MKKKIFTREVKLGLVAILAIFVLYFGLNFLKGINIFTPTSYYYGTYDNIGGLVESAPVYIKGYKVGQVEEIKYDFLSSPAFIIRIGINKDLRLPKGTQMLLIDDGLLGGKIIHLVYPDTHNEQFYAASDTLVSTLAGGLLDDLGSLMPKLSGTIEHLDSLLYNVNNVVKGDEIQHTLASLDKTTSELALSSTQLKFLLKNDVPDMLDKVQVLVTDFGAVGQNLKQIDFASTVNTLDSTLNNLQLLTSKLNSNESSLGLLMNDKQLYVNLSNTASSADKLLVDLQQHPKRYVHFSLFGKNKSE